MQSKDPKQKEMSKMNDFTHLHVHSGFSVRDAVQTPRQLCDQASLMGFDALAITDHGNIGSHYQFAIAAYDTMTGDKKNPKPRNPIKAIFGVEAYVCDDISIKQSIEVKDADGNRKKRRPKHHHLVLLAKNDEGYANLMKLCNIASMEGFYYEPRIDWSLIEPHSAGLICMSACIGGEVGTLIRNGEKEKAFEVVDRYHQLFKDDFYLEVQAHGLPEEAFVYSEIERIADDMKIPLVATNDVHYMRKEDSRIHDIIVSMKFNRDEEDGGSSDSRDLKSAYKKPEFYLKSEQEMLSTFERRPEVVTRTREIVEKCEFNFSLSHPIIWPKFEIQEDDQDTATRWRKENVPEQSPEQAILSKKVLEGLVNLGLSKKSEYLERAKYELNAIYDLGYERYFLVQDMIVRMCDERKIMLGPGRGSGAGSLVLFALGITKVDPLRHDLLFERFLNPGRGPQFDHRLDLPEFDPDYEISERSTTLRQYVLDKLREENNLDDWPMLRTEILSLESQELDGKYFDAITNGSKCQNKANSLLAWKTGICDDEPSGQMRLKGVPGLADIDSDFDQNRREEVLQMVSEYFGEDNVSHIGTYGQYGLKMAAQTVARHRGMDSMTLKTITKGVNYKTKDIDTAMTESENFRIYMKNYPEDRELIMGAIGAYNNLGVHASGIVIGPNPISEIVPVSMTNKGVVTSIDMRDVEGMGLVKYDFLGLDNVTKISKCLDLIEQRYEKKIDLTKIPLWESECRTDGEKQRLKTVIGRFNNADVDTIFQFETGLFSQILSELNVTSFSDLVAIVALGRPGSMKFISDKYYERCRDKDKDPDTSPIGTYKGNKRNPENIRSPHPICSSILSDTYGIPVYQEQAMRIFQLISGSSLVEADIFRKAIGKKSGYLFDKCQKLFMNGCTKNGLTEGQINAIWKLFEDFAGYSFNKSHATAYALLGFWNAWLREFFPSEWYAAVLSTELSNSKKDMIEPQKFGYLRDHGTKLEWYRKMCRKRTESKVNVINPDVNISHHADAMINDKGHIILPLCTIPTLGGNTESIADNRPYKNIDDLVERSGASPSVLRVLVDHGAVDMISNAESKDDVMRRLEESILKKQERKRAEGSILKRKGTIVENIVVDGLFGDFEGTLSISMVAKADKVSSDRKAKKAAEEAEKKKEAAKNKKKGPPKWD